MADEMQPTGNAEAEFRAWYGCEPPTAPPVNPFRPMVFRDGSIDLLPSSEALQWAVWRALQQGTDS